jgi:hypothetical protein
MVSSNNTRYFQSVEKSTKKYNAALKSARSKQSIMNLYWRHKRQHEVLLKQHLKEEMQEIITIKKKFG